MDRTAVLMEWARALLARGEVPPSERALREIGARGAIPAHLRTPDLDRWARVIQHLLWLVNQGHPAPVADALRLDPDGPPVGPMHQPSGPMHQPSGPMHQPSGPMHQPSGPMHQPSGPMHQPSGPMHQPSGPMHQPSAVGQDLSVAPVDAVPPPRSAAEHSQATTSLRTGQPGNTGPEEPQQSAAPPPNESPREKVQRLLMWRDAQGLSELKDRHIRQVVNAEPRRIAEVAAGLPASLKSLAEQIAGELGLQAGDTVSGAATEATAHTPQPAGAHGGGNADHNAAGTGASAPATSQAQDSQSFSSGALSSGAPSPEPPSPEALSPEALNPGALTWNDPIALDNAMNQFAPVDLTRPQAEPGQIRTSPTRDGVGVRLTWDKQTGPYVEYRIVSDDDHQPISPEHADVVGITDRTVFTDTRAFHTAVRHYRIWANIGSDQDSARAEQPVLVAEASVVTRPDEVVIREDEGRVIGQWTLPHGVRRVLVHRVPQERAGAGAGSPEFRICANENNLGGFVDYDAEPGRKYHYQLQVEAEGSSQLSFPTSVPVTTSAVLEPVVDLDCELGEDEDAQFTLAWTPPPIGHVEIYRTQNGPRAGADNDTVSQEALPQMGLRSEDQLAHPVQPDGGKSRMQEVPWPRGWSRTYFTPVTLLDGQARVGRTISRVRTSPVTDAKLIERVSQQVLTMAWPAGAANVKVYSGPIGQSAEETITSSQPIAEISADAYERFGGLHFSQPLDPLGCDLHLVSVAFSEGSSVEGRPTTITSPPLLKINYTVQVQPGGDGRPWALIAMTTDLHQQGEPPMAFVFNHERLPLDINDGQQLPVMPQTGGHASQRFRPTIGPDTGEIWWAAALPSNQGWMRLFIDFTPPSGTIAVLDPPVHLLRIGNPS